jgi:hypothetical protein
MKHSLGRLLFPAAFAAAIAAPLPGAEPGAPFLTVLPSVRADALGGTGVAALGADAVGMNPALAVPMRGDHQVATSWSRPWEGTVHGHVAWAGALGKNRLGVGAAVTYFSSAGEQSLDIYGTPVGGDTSARDAAATFTLSHRLANKVRIGAAGKLFQSTLAGTRSALSGAADLGIGFPYKDFVVSLSANNLGPGQKFLDQRDPLPGFLRADASWRRGPLLIAGGVQRDLARDQSRLGGGTEYNVGPLALRVGYNARIGGPSDRSAGDGLRGLAAGMGVAVGDLLRVDYALKENASDLGWVHRLGVTWHVGAPTPSARRPVAPPRRSVPRVRGIRKRAP